MDIKKLIAVLLTTALCMILLLPTLSANAIGETVTATSTYDPAAKTVTISGTAKCQQVIISITKEGSVEPSYYGFASVTSNAYTVTRQWSVFPEGIYKVAVVNSDDGSKAESTFSTIDNTALLAAINVIKGYADSNDASALTVAQLNAVGVTGVITENLNAYKTKIASANASDVDTQVKIQLLIDTVNTEEAASNKESVTVLATYNNVAKTVTITGFATSQQVTVTIKRNGEVTPVWYGGVNVSNNNYSLERPVSTYLAGEYTITVENINDATVVIDTFVISSDTTAPVITIGDYVKAPTNKDIVVTATTNEGTLNVASHTFTENESFEFIATDNAGNVSKVTVTITNIDKVAPTFGNPVFSKTELTKENVTVTITVTGATVPEVSHVFTDNGSYEFVASDLAGNEVKKTVTVNNILPENSSITFDEGYAFGFSDKMTLSDTKAILGNDVVVTDANGNNISDSSLIGTGCTIKVAGFSYTVVVMGDVNGDGGIDSKDYLFVKRAFMKTYTLSEEQLKASCFDGTPLPTAKDYLKIKRYFLGTYDIFA